MHEISSEVRSAVLELLGDLRQWEFDCHAASLHVVREIDPRLLPQARVARGSCTNVPGQHSWVVTGHPFLPNVIIDPTLWSYDPDVEGVVFVEEPRAMVREHLHRWTPHQATMLGALPVGRGGEEVMPDGDLSQWALGFLDQCRLLGPLDVLFWGRLASGPLMGWPSGEIIDAMYRTPTMRGLVPIDAVGMLTDHNPGGLYLPEKVGAGERTP